MHAFDLRLDHDYEAHGTWWLPENSANRVPGRVTYSVDGGIELECHGSLLEGRPWDHEAVTIHGELQYDGPATLFGAIGNWDFGATIQLQTFVSRTAVIGMHAASPDADVRSLAVLADNFNEWLSSGPFDTADRSHGDDPRVTRFQYEVNTEPLGPWRIDSINSSAHVGMMLSQRGVGHSTTLVCERFTQFVSPDSLSLREALRIATGFELLLTLLTGGVSLLQSVKLRPPSDHVTSADVHCLVSRPRNERRKRLFNRQLMPATFDALGEAFPAILDRWFSVYGKYAPVIRLLAHSLFSAEGRFLEEQFLTVAQAVEGYCRISQGDKYLEDGQFEPIRKALLASVPLDLPHRFRELAATRIGWMNDYSLSDRLLALYEKREWLGTFLVTRENPEPSRTTWETFVREVTKIRNSLTHVESTKDLQIDLRTIWRLRAVLL
jgi:hypothetical protein